MNFPAEFRAEMSGDTLAGVAAVFDSPTRLPDHWEALAPGAFDKALRRSDVRALLNHDPSLLLARQSAGTLRLRADKAGLHFEMDLPNTSYAADLRSLVARGDITGMSFGFIPGEQERTRSRDGRPLVTHTSVKRLLDVSPVTFPAYEGTEVHLRAEESYMSNRDRLIRVRARVLLGGSNADVR